jgi:elongation factor P
MQERPVDVERRPLEYLYAVAGGAVFMDSRSFDSITVNDALLGDARHYLKDDTVLVGLFREGELVGLEPPAVVELEVTETPPGVRSAATGDQTKEATCETGLKTQVPTYVNRGDVIRVSTTTGQYLGRK